MRVYAIPETHNLASERLLLAGSVPVDLFHPLKHSQTGFNNTCAGVQHNTTNSPLVRRILSKNAKPLLLYNLTKTCELQKKYKKYLSYKNYISKLSENNVEVSFLTAGFSLSWCKADFEPFILLRFVVISLEVAHSDGVAVRSKCAMFTILIVRASERVTV